LGTVCSIISSATRERGEKTITTFARLQRASFVAAVFFLWTLSQSAFATGTPDKECTTGALPVFADYAVPVQNIPKRPKLKRNNRFSHMFKTRLKNGLHGKPVDFAGHYIIVTFGCGTGCLYGGYVDADSGQAMELPFMVNAPRLVYVPRLVERKADSRLLIVRGTLSEDDDRAMKYFFSLQGSKLVPICHAPLDDKTP